MDDDPFAEMTAPPRNETFEERQIREAAEAEAKRISDEIDERLRREKENEPRKKRPVKLLLLGMFLSVSDLAICDNSIAISGQSESGKTATLKSKYNRRGGSNEADGCDLLDFQLTYARREWAEERAAWRSVIFLNFVRNVNLVVDHLNAEMSDYPVVNHDESQEDITSRSARALPRLKFNDEHRRLRTRLSKLVEVQLELERRLGSASLEMWSTTVDTAAPFDQEPGPSSGKRGMNEFSIHSSNGWKTALGKLKTLRTPGQGSSRGDSHDGESNGSPVATSPSAASREWEDEIGESLELYRNDIKTLWEDSTVHEVLSRRKIRLEDMPGLCVLFPTLCTLYGLV